MNSSQSAVSSKEFICKPPCDTHTVNTSVVHFAVYNSTKFKHTHTRTQYIHPFSISVFFLFLISWVQYVFVTIGNTYRCRGDTRNLRVYIHIRLSCRVQLFFIHINCLAYKIISMDEHYDYSFIFLCILILTKLLNNEIALFIQVL